MDPFTALSLAGVIIQFIDFGVKLTVHSSEVYQSVHGNTEADKIILQDTNHLARFSEQLQQSLSNRHSEAEVKIASLARECAIEADKLRAILHGLQGLTLGDKIKVILDGLDGKSDAEKLSTLLGRLQDRSEADELAAILRGHEGDTDAKKLKVIVTKVPPRNSKGKLASSIVTALRSLRKKKEVQEIYESLKEYRAQLTLCMVGLLK